MHFSPATEFKKGIIPWCTGKKLGPHSEEHRRKVSLALTGRKHPPEFGTKIRAAKLGKKRGPMPEEWRRKISAANRGKKRLPETCRRMSRGKLGHTFSEPVKARLRAVLLEGRMLQASNHRTSIENRLYESLASLGVPFIPQKLMEGKFLVDAYIPGQRLVIEADGDYWHALPRVQARDRAKNAYLTKCGYRMLRLSETEIRNDTFLEKLGGELLWR